MPGGGTLPGGLPILDPNLLNLRATKRDGSFADFPQGVQNYRATRRDGTILPFSFAATGVVRATRRSGAFRDVSVPWENDPGGGPVHVHSLSYQACPVCGQVVGTCACGYRGCGH